LKVIQLHKKDHHQSTINLLKKQNRDAQQMIYTKYSPKMLGVCRQYISDMQHAEEAMLNGFLKVFTKIDKFQSKGRFEGCIRRIMVNECISF
jgi:RNA polymerase sigma-70 factor (ECF subfamily)